jgi:hypothetical protein
VVCGAALLLGEGGEAGEPGGALPPLLVPLLGLLGLLLGLLLLGLLGLLLLLLLLLLLFLLLVFLLVLLLLLLLLLLVLDRADAGAHALEHDASRGGPLLLGRLPPRLLLRPLPRARIRAAAARAVAPARLAQLGQRR